MDWLDIDIWLRFSLIFDLVLWLNNIIPKRAIIYKQNLALTQQITFWLVKRMQDFVKGATPPWGATGSDWIETFPPPEFLADFEIEIVNSHFQQLVYQLKHTFITKIKIPN